MFSNYFPAPAYELFQYRFDYSEYYSVFLFYCKTFYSIMDFSQPFSSQYHFPFNLNFHSFGRVIWLLLSLIKTLERDLELISS
jgi:hypothetical protein